MLLFPLGSGPLSAPHPRLYCTALRYRPGRSTSGPICWHLAPASPPLHWSPVYINCPNLSAKAHSDCYHVMLCERWGMPTYLWRRAERQRGQKKRGQAGLGEKKKGKWLENDMRNRDHMTGGGRDGTAVETAREMCKKCCFDGLVKTGAVPSRDNWDSPDRDVIELHGPSGLLRSRFEVCRPTRPPQWKVCPHFASQTVPIQGLFLFSREKSLEVISCLWESWSFEFVTVRQVEI